MLHDRYCAPIFHLHTPFNAITLTLPFIALSHADAHVQWVVANGLLHAVC